VAWDKTPPAPELPEDVIRASSRRYADAFEQLVDPDKPLRFTRENWR